MCEDLQARIFELEHELDLRAKDIEKLKAQLTLAKNKAAMAEWYEKEAGLMRKRLEDLGIKY